jgi:hypothetical protein
MRYFHRVASGVNVASLAHAVARQPWLWNQHRFRTTFPNTPHVDVDDIWLRFSDPEKCDTTSNVIGDDNPIWHDAARSLPQAKPLILDLMRAVDAYALDRVLITRLAPGGRILPHADKDGSYVNTQDRSRYHVVLQGLPGSLYKCGDETVEMLTGDIYWFDAHSVHEVLNNSVGDRVHLLVDVRIYP